VSLDLAFVPRAVPIMPGPNMMMPLPAYPLQGPAAPDGPEPLLPAVDFGTVGGPKWPLAPQLAMHGFHHPAKAVAVPKGPPAGVPLPAKAMANVPQLPKAHAEGPPPKKAGGKAAKKAGAKAAKGGKAAGKHPAAKAAGA
jgi:hypothetical protein